MILLLGAPIFWGYISGRVKRHKIGLLLTCIPYLYFLTQVLVLLTSGFMNIIAAAPFLLMLSGWYFAEVVLGYYLGYVGFGWLYN
jgi:hypothetical protein